MKKKIKNGLRPEYDFRQLKGGVKGKYATRFRSGTNLIDLDSDLAQVFENEKSVNQALRSIIKLAKTEVVYAH